MEKMNGMRQVIMDAMKKNGMKPIGKCPRCGEGVVWGMASNGSDRPLMNENHDYLKICGKCAIRATDKRLEASQRANEQKLSEYEQRMKEIKEKSQSIPKYKQDELRQYNRYEKKNEFGDRA